MVADLVRELAASFPWLFSWCRDRLQVELPAFLVSLTVHGLLLASLALAGYSVHKESPREFASTVVADNLLTSGSEFQDLDQSSDPPSTETVAGSFAPTLATNLTISAGSRAEMLTPTVTADSTHGAASELVKLDVKRATEIALPTSTLLGQTVSIRGNGAEIVGNVDGAVDRIATEIVRRLEQGRTLVVWAFDASGSLQAERLRLVQHIETVYRHIDQLDQNHLSSDNGLMTMVVAFGHDHQGLLQQPTAERSEIVDAIKRVSLDKTGIETTFTTVDDIVRHWGHYRDAHKQSYRTMVIVVTDEVGDDEEQLEIAIAHAQKARVPIYVLGSQAVFGRREGYMDYADPSTKHVFRNVPVRQGPESIAVEQIRLPFWYHSPQYDLVESGFGPFALSRLAAATGGIYFITRFDTRRMSFDLARMWEYKPDWVRRDEYEKEVSRSPLRQAILTAAQITNQKLPGMPSLSFPPAEDPAFKEAMSNNQAIAERTAYTIDEALTAINLARNLRDREKSRRWQAHYDLIRGRLLAMKVRCFEYNWACAVMKKDPLKFRDAKSNAWQLVPDTGIQYSKNAEAAAKEALVLLRQVVRDHKATPWALLAERELENSLGFKWAETYVAPRPRMSDAVLAKRQNKMTSQLKPPEMPKL